MARGNNKFKIILASSSPRRRELMQQMGFKFAVKSPDIVEVRRANESPSAYVKRNASEKARAVAAALTDRKRGQTVVVAADTIVVLGKRVLEKPQTVTGARAMLGSLSGRTHAVLTGVTVLAPTSMRTFVVKTRVTFKSLSSGEISRYIATGEPFDKAGGYGAQGVGAYFIKNISGSYSNVVGLPASEVYEVLAVLGRPLLGWR